MASSMLSDLKKRVKLSTVELNAGLASFLTMSYILVLNPQIVSLAGLDEDAIFMATALVSGVGNIVLGYFSGLPMAIAPAMGLNT
jgi:AGZA family xanthine/uracil permease-like MFS transporter